jgi:hypothetical protein
VPRTRCGVASRARRISGIPLSKVGASMRAPSSPARIVRAHRIEDEPERRYRRRWHGRSGRRAGQAPARITEVRAAIGLLTRSSGSECDADAAAGAPHRGLVRKARFASGRSS